MIRSLLSRRSESFLVLDLSLQNIKALLLSVDSARAIHFHKYWERFTWERWSAKLPGVKGMPKVIVGVHPSLITTKLVHARLEREHPDAPLTTVEFHHMLNKLVTDILASERSRAAKTLGEQEIHTILVGVRACTLTVDGRDVLSPIGLPAHKIEGVFEVSFTVREVFERWRSFFSAPGRFFFCGGAQAQLFALKRVYQSAPVKLLYITDDLCSLFTFADFDKPTSLTQKHIPWSPQPLVALFQERWGVSPASAKELYRLCARHEVSPAVRSFVESEFTASMEALTHGVARTKISGDIVVSSTIELPHALPYKSESCVLHGIPTEHMMERLGFSLASAPGVKLPYNVYGYLASFLEFYYDKNNYAANQWLRSRVHWLSPL